MQTSYMNANMLGKKAEQKKEEKRKTVNPSEVKQVESQIEDETPKKAVAFKKSKDPRPRLTALQVDRNTEDFHYVGFYRHIEKQLPLAIKSSAAFFKWPPKFVFFSSGYYKDWQSKIGLQMKTHTIKLHRVPPDVNVETLRPDFAGDPKIERKGKVINVNYDEIDDAQAAFTSSRFVKIGSGDLLYLVGSDFYILGIPKNTTEDLFKSLYPTAAEVVVNHNGPGYPRIIWKSADFTRSAIIQIKSDSDQGCDHTKYNEFYSGESYAYLRFEDVEERDRQFNNGVLPVAGYNALNGSDMSGSSGQKKSRVAAVAPESNVSDGSNEVVISGIPKKGFKEEELKRFFPSAKNLKIVKAGAFGGKTNVVLEFESPEDAISATNKASPTYFSVTGPQQLKIKVKKLPPVGELLDEEIENMTDSELAHVLWEFEAEFSNISNYFTPTISISGLPPSQTRTELLKTFPESKKIDLKKEGKTLTATVEFDDAQAAARGFATARKMTGVNGKNVVVKAVQSPGVATAKRKASRRGTRKSIARKSQVGASKAALK